MERIRAAREGDLCSIRCIVDAIRDLDKHTTYTYWVARKMFPELFLVADIKEQVVGFTFGVQKNDCVFLWQVGVLENFRHHGIASRLIHEFINQAKQRGAVEMLVTISPSNRASKRVFESVAKDSNSELLLVGSTEPYDLFPIENIYSVQLN